MGQVTYLVAAPDTQDQNTTFDGMGLPVMNEQHQDRAAVTAECLQVLNERLAPEEVEVLLESLFSPHESQQKAPMLDAAFQKLMYGREIGKPEDRPHLTLISGKK